MQLAIKLAFVDTFRLVLSLAAGLAWLSAVLAGIILQPRAAAADAAAVAG